MPDAEQFGYGPCFFFLFGARRAAHPKAVGNVSFHGHVRKERVVLIHEAYAAFGERNALHGRSVEQNVAAFRCIESGGRFEKQGFSRACAAEDGKDFPFAEFKGYVLNAHAAPGEAEAVESKRNHGLTAPSMRLAARCCSSVESMSAAPEMPSRMMAAAMAMPLSPVLMLR